MDRQLFSGIWPVVPTVFDETGSVDYDGQRNVIECLVDQGVDGCCILANYSEQFLLSDDERLDLTKFCLNQARGRIPVIVTISHYATKIAVERADLAKKSGAAAVMMMPPYHGATLRGTSQQTFDQVRAVGQVGIPIMIQDAPLSGVDLPVDFLVRMARQIEMVKLFKIESTGAADKLRTLIQTGGDAIEAPFDGEEGITILADLDAGATGSMTSALIPDLIRPVIVEHQCGNRDNAQKKYETILPIINHENKQCGFRATKFAMKEGGVIKSDFSRHPIAPLGLDAKNVLLELLRPRDPVVLRWGK